MNKNYNIHEGSKRFDQVEMSSIRIVMEKARSMKEQGIDIISLSAGEPDFNTPSPIIKATIEALEHNMTHYSSNRGDLVLRKEIAKMIKEDTGVEYNPQTEIVITNGGAEALQNAMFSVLNVGDEVIIPTPAFVSYKNIAKLCGAMVIELPLKECNEFQLDIEELSQTITEKTKMIILNNPNNPTGAVYTKELLAQVSQLAMRDNLIILSDEMYNHLLYEDAEYTSMVSFSGMKERTFLVNGFSKTFAMTGWRLGYIAADEKFISNMLKIHQYTTTTATTFSQCGAAVAMNSDETQCQVAYMVDEFAKRRDLIMSKLDEIDTLSYVKPNGAFYIMVNVSKTGLTGKEFADKLLDEKYVATVPAEGLGKECVDFVRISFSTSNEIITAGMERMKDFVEQL